MTVPAIFSFCLGACVASFLNVVIWRVPRGESIVRPPSHCPKCGAPVKWWQNIPVLSYLALRGRCASCKEAISPRYAAVEALGALLFVVALARYGAFAPFAWVWISLMIAGAFIDIDHKVLPDFVTAGGMVYGVALSCALWFAEKYGFPSPELRSLAPETMAIHPLSSLAGLALGFGLMWTIRFFGTKAFKREAMGEGDVWLMGAVGAMFGPIAAIATLILSSLAGSLAGLAMILLGRTRFGKFAEIPYGPYICAGCAVWMFRGEELLDWYLGFTGLK